VFLVVVFHCECPTVPTIIIVCLFCLSHHCALSTIGKRLMSRATLRWFGSFRPTMQELLNIEQFCQRKNSMKSKQNTLGNWDKLSVLLQSP
jgi:hypothetical protein